MSVESASFSMGRTPQRQVWIINIHPTKDFEQEWRGEKMLIPANRVKKVHREYLDAEEFLSVPCQPQTFDNVGNEIAIGKPLKIEELTAEEAMKFDPRNKHAGDYQERAERTCTICGKELQTKQGLKAHVTTTHEGYQEVKSL